MARKANALPQLLKVDHDDWTKPTPDLPMGQREKGGDWKSID
ncbi:MAG: hypothetical protein CM15mP74_27340 [Halieaceae bacterium]|nr:MAG: hypothetical protein CM15mP74_27340 [Halieaceae bacterium]